MRKEELYTDGCIATYTGKLVNILNPNIEDINIEDIAYALSNINRFNGHSKRNISVLSHSINVCLAAPSDIKLEALLHDAHEAYIGDIASPIKSAVPGFKKLDDFWVSVIAKKFNLSFDKLKRVQEFDVLLLEKEFEFGFCDPGSVAVGSYPIQTFMRFFNDLYFG